MLENALAAQPSGHLPGIVLRSGQVHLLAGRLREAGEAATRALDLGMRPLAARCRLGLGELHRRAGRLQHAQEHLTAAATMFREMDMRLWLEKTEAETKKLA